MSPDEEVTSSAACSAAPNHFIRVAVVGHAGYEAFLTGMPNGLPGVLRVESHLTMKSLRAGA